ncbi:hypothetical protein [Streptomyces sp. NBC_00859]|uniref:hypothetical protein n=1 Tax=Streptomyces sp. NBC_00859 TaxID=2903682 RepID=UPI00386D9DC8|nr:hypothetical protein OG584_04825 [Streptomyces sp. NBC_00859]
MTSPPESAPASLPSVPSRGGVPPGAARPRRATAPAAVRSLLSAAAGLAISAACGQGVPAAAAESPLLVSSITLPTHLAALEVDNSNADSWLEVDRTANAQTGAGDAGSDHEGGD